MFSQVGSHLIYITLYDGQDYSLLNSMNIIVTNSAPRFVGGVPVDQTVKFNEISTYTLPRIVDDEKNAWTVTNVQLFSFV